MIIISCNRCPIVFSRFIIHFYSSAKGTINKIKANEVLAAANNLIGTDRPETMRNYLRAMMDCFCLNGEADNKDFHYCTFIELDRLLRSLDEMAEII